MTTGLCAPGEPTAIDPDAFFAPKESPLYWQARALCMACPLFFDCQDTARAEGIPYGIWGGESSRDRERYWKRSGGRPTHFVDALSREVNVVLQERRDYENFDRLRDKPTTDEFVEAVA